MTEKFGEIDFDAIDFSKYAGNFEAHHGEVIHDEGDDMDSYTVMALNQMIDEAVSKLQELENYIDNDEYIVANKSRFEVLRKNVKNIISRMDVIWAEDENLN